jgi:hypothetical protein
MPESEKSKSKNLWEKADIISKWLIPVAIALATIWFNSTLKEREARQKTFEVAIGILQAPKSDETQQLREWALGVFQDVSGKAYAGLPIKAVQEIREGAQIPSTSQLRLPTSGQLRVSIIRLEGTPPAQSDQIKTALVSAGYVNVTTGERSSGVFPQKAEVRYYYPSDSLNAQSLTDYINRNVPGLVTTAKDKSQDPDASTHRPGDLHVYVR